MVKIVLKPTSASTTSISGNDVNHTYIWTTDNTSATYTTSDYTYIPSTTAQPIIYTTTTGYAIDDFDLLEELRPSSKFEEGQLVIYIGFKKSKNVKYALIHEAYENFCIIILDFKFYKVESNYLVDALDK